jgi:hypothetical protein
MTIENKQYTELTTEEPVVKINEEIINISGKIARSKEPLILDGQRWSNIKRTLPVIKMWIFACLLITLISLLMTLASFFWREKPLLLITYPDGTLRCAPLTLLASGQNTKRPLKEANYCLFLEKRVGEPLGEGVIP